jgi:hypothetical protein
MPRPLLPLQAEIPRLPSVAASFDFALRPFDGAQDKLCSGQAQDRLPFGPFGFAQGRLLGMTVAEL